MNKRLLSPNNLPSSLWNSSEDLLYISPRLSEIYSQLIDELGLLEKSLQRGKGDGPIGGLTEELTYLHFAQAFDGSVARVQLATLDPKDEVGEVSNAFIMQLSGGSLLITDAPCGCGAATFSFLSTIVELRERKILPRLPLDVNIIGAEISEPAKKIAQKILEKLRPAMEMQAITVNANFYDWDVTSVPSNTQLIKKMNIGFEKNPKRLLIVANFSGFLKAKLKESEKQIIELLRYASEENSFGVWIEPQKNTATQKGGLFPWLADKVKTVLKSFVISASIDDADSTHLQTHSKFVLPLQPNNKVEVRLAVVSLKLNINE